MIANSLLPDPVHKTIISVHNIMCLMGAFERLRVQIIMEDSSFVENGCFSGMTVVLCFSKRHTHKQRF